MTTRNFIKTPTARAVAIALGSLTLVPQFALAQQSSGEQRIEITGSRIKRADAEGALPVTVIDRAAIEATGKTSVAELMRDTTFASFGNFKPQSGSSAQALADIDLRGLGSNRTLVLLDGRRIAKAPFSGQSQDLNSIPLAAVERIEILSDGASAIYGSDAIGGVVNIITRKNFNGVQLTYGQGKPDVEGGRTRETGLLLGMSGNKGRVIVGMSADSRGMIFTRDQIGGDVQGVSSFGNNYRLLTAGGVATGGFIRVPNFACNTDNFWVTSGNTCSFDFNKLAANEASVDKKSIFSSADYTINDDWSLYAFGSVTQVHTFGRYAPTPVQVTLSNTSSAYQTIRNARIAAGLPDISLAPRAAVAATQNTPAISALVQGVDVSPNGLSLRHRMAAAGTRDTHTNATIPNGLIGFKGRLFNRVDVDFGMRTEKYRYIEQGQNYIVRPLLETAINSGSYNIFNPFGNSADVLNSVKSTISRDDLWDTKEVFGTASMDLFKIGSGTVTGLIGFESRKEFYQDNYDPQSEAGIIEGSSGNSAAGSRKVKSTFFEIVAPVMGKTLELSLAGRHDSYNDAGSKFSPKFSARFQPIKMLTTRASYGQGFRAPTLDVMTQKPAFSADSVFDLRTCRAFGGSAAACGDTNGNGVIDGTETQTRQVQVDATIISNPGLRPETSKQTSFGIVLDATDWLSATVDFYSIKINGRMTSMSSQTILNRISNPALGPVPAAFSVTRDTLSGAITNITRGTVNEGDLATSGFDMTLRGDFKLGSFGRLRSNWQYSQVSKYTINGGDNLVGTQGSPKYRLTLANNYSWNNLEATLAYLYIAKQPGDGVSEPETAAYGTVNLSASYTLPTKTKLSVGIINAGNKKPELQAYDGRPWNFYLYDALGRQTFFRITQTF